ncbi:MAG: hypothetical protein KAV00_03835, partial [Phycisphaerae bacterium]|nr:hypothetical protein [Phycisphaerae bacterium]
MVDVVKELHRFGTSVMVAGPRAGAGDGGNPVPVDQAFEPLAVIITLPGFERTDADLERRIVTVRFRHHPTGKLALSLMWAFATQHLPTLDPAQSLAGSLDVVGRIPAQVGGVAAG